MNFSRKATSRKRDALISRSSMLGKRARVSFIRAMFFSLIALIVMGVCLGVGSVRGIIDNAPDVNAVDIMPLGYASFLYDDQNNMIRKLAAPSSNRQPVSIEQIPQNLQDAVVAIEDERFYEHNGIDVKGIVRAGVADIMSGDLSQGASTITQQLLKNNVFTNWTEESSLLEKFTRKFQEQFLAIQVEEKINDKSVILVNYLNTINLGSGAYGVQAAARQYFNKDVWNLNLSECATLASITKSPYYYDPIYNPANNNERRMDVLDKMLELGYITQAEYLEAANDDVYARIRQAQIDTVSSRSTIYTYFEDELTEQVINDLMSIRGYTLTQARNMLYSGGLSIYTTLDPTIQAILDDEYSDPSNFPPNTEYALDFALTVRTPDGNEVNYSKEMLAIYFQNQEGYTFDLLFDTQEEARGYVERYKDYVLSDGSTVVAERVNFIPQPQSSMTVIDQHTGYVKALIGGRGRKTASLTLNRATDTTRQPGSTFKIVSTYAPALNEKGMSLATTFVDEPYSYPDGSPVNNSSRTYGGVTTIHDAIIRSVNVVAVKCMEAITPALGLRYLDNFGFTTLAHGTAEDIDYAGNVWSDENLATAIGGITNGVTNVELCAAYASIANEGNYIKPIYYTKILDHNGNVLIENTSASRSVIKPTTAWLLTRAMEDVIASPYGTAQDCALDHMPVAGKTGTTDAYNDLWFVGYTPYYTCAVWAGYDNNEKMPDGTRTYHRQLWTKVMNRIHQDLPYTDFRQPAGIQEVSMCTISGLRATAYCPSVIHEYFDGDTAPKEVCEECEYDYFYDQRWYYQWRMQQPTVNDPVIEVLPTQAPENANPSFSENTGNGTINWYDNTGTQTWYDNTGGTQNWYDNTGGTQSGYDNSGITSFADEDIYYFPEEAPAQVTYY